METRQNAWAVPLICVSALLSWAGPACAQVWTLETVGSAVRARPSIATNAGGSPGVTYYTGNANLGYATRIGESWVTTTVDSAAYSGIFSSLRYDSAGTPHVAYNHGASGTGKYLRYATWNGASWDSTVVDAAVSMGDSVSLAIDSAGRAHIAYFDYITRHLKYAAWDGASWSVSTVDGSYDSGYHLSLAMDSADRARISYLSATGGQKRLKYAAWNGAAWDVSAVPTSSVDAGYYSSLALDAADNPRIAYYDQAYTALKYAAWNGSAWDISTVADAEYSGWFASMVLDNLDNPHISYVTTNGIYFQLNYAANSGSGWQVSSIDYRSKETSIAVDADNRPLIAYYSEPGSVRLACVPEPSGIALLAGLAALLTSRLRRAT